MKKCSHKGKPVVETPVCKKNAQKKTHSENKSKTTDSCELQICESKRSNGYVTIYP